MGKTRLDIGKVAPCTRASSIVIDANTKKMFRVEIVEKIHKKPYDITYISRLKYRNHNGTVST